MVRSKLKELYRDLYLVTGKRYSRFGNEYKNEYENNCTINTDGMKEYIALLKKYTDNIISNNIDDNINRIEPSLQYYEAHLKQNGCNNEQLQKIYKENKENKPRKVLGELTNNKSIFTYNPYANSPWHQP